MRFPFDQRARAYRHMHPAGTCAACGRGGARRRLIGWPMHADCRAAGRTTERRSKASAQRLRRVQP